MVMPEFFVSKSKTVKISGMCVLPHFYRISSLGEMDSLVKKM